MGILDGTHIYISPTAEEQASYANRKKRMTINNLILVDIDGEILYVKAGRFSISRNQVIHL